MKNLVFFLISSLTLFDLIGQDVPCPSTIRVGTSCSGHSCSAATVEVVDFQIYTANVLTNEWGQWGAWPNGIHSLSAGSVAIRSYALNRVNYPISQHGNNVNYEICNTTSCHVYKPEIIPSTYANTAVTNTGSYILKGGPWNVALSEFAAETNDIGNSGCSYPYYGICGDGKFQQSFYGPGLPNPYNCTNGGGCYPATGTDPVCIGKTREGHSRGMCQRGSIRWASGYSVPSNLNMGTLTGQPTKTWQELLAYYYPYYTLTTTSNLCGGTTSQLDCSNAIQLQCGVTYHGPPSSASSNVNSYTCNNWTETGPERVHIINTSQIGTLTATISNFTGDLDVYILGSCDPNNCLGTVYSSSSTYNNAPIGQYFIIVDSDDGSGSSYDLLVTSSCGTQTYSINTSSNPIAGGTTNGAGNYLFGQQVTVVATSNLGYTFENWTENGNYITSNTSYTFNVTENRNLTANFSSFFQPFITTWKTDNPGTSNSTSITIPTTGGGYNYDVDWDDDGIYDQFGVSGNITHDYGVAGTYTIRIRGTFPRIYFNNGGDRQKILSIDQWGDISWTSMHGAFFGASNLISNASDSPNLSGVTDMSYMLYLASAFNGDVSTWDVSNVTNLRGMFHDANSFNGDVSTWDVSNVTDMFGMFSHASLFNGDVSGWDVSNVTNMNQMFHYASSFNRDLGGWDVSKVVDMGFMFGFASSFNGNVSGWDVSNVTNMGGMFSGTFSFNGDVSTWDVSNVTNMASMFYEANSFNGDVSVWDVSSVTNMSYMFYGVGSFNGNVSGWDVSSVTDMSLMFYEASSFNGDVSTWDVSNVTNMGGMFSGTFSFNGDVSTWDVSNVTNMASMFAGASSFNGDISGWDVSNVTNMQAMFISAISFNGDLSGWDVSSVTDMSYMFVYASFFNRDLGGWDIRSVAIMENMLNYSGLSVTNYDNTLIGWESQGVSNQNLGAYGLNYCNAESARNSLIANYGWTIYGDNLNCSEFSQPFITTWKTDNPGTSNSTSITIPTTGGGYNYDVDWDNDGIYDQFGINGTVTHDYGLPGIYTIRIRGTFPRIYFNNGGDRQKILSIDQWGDIVWTSMSRAFLGATNLTCNVSDSPDLSGVTDMSGMFGYASSFNRDLSAWDVSNVTNMLAMFYEASSFNGDVSTWNVSSVTNMNAMFGYASSFNRDLSAWDVSNVTNMAGMFSGASSFNEDISAWDVSNVTDMSSMFSIASSFNRDLSAWDVSNVTSMNQMFDGSNSFNGDISAWDVSGVTDMLGMFGDANSFNGDISAWDVSNVTDMSFMFGYASSFNGDISAWDVSGVTNMVGMFSGASSFNRDLSAWDVSGVTNMVNMFSYASSFNGDISAWDVSNVTNMVGMFSYASSFNGDISSWDVSNVTDMRFMFASASTFDRDLGNWDIRAVANMANMLNYSGLSLNNYDNTLIGWESQGVTNLSLGAFGLSYCNGESARNSLIETYGWTIIGDNLNCVDSEPPVALCKNISIFLDLYGNASISPDDINDGSTDNSGITLITLNPNQFDCDDLGDNIVSLTAWDAAGNSSNCASIIMVKDNINPEITCNDISINFDGEASIVLNPETMAQSTDNCSIVGFEANPPFIDCDAVGQIIPITITANDPSGNSASCISHVTVEGLPCGWTPMPDGIGCVEGNDANYDIDTGTYTLMASGCYSSNSSVDESGFIMYPLCGNGSITAHVAGLTLPGFAGIVMRESDAPGSKKVAMVYQGSSFLARFVRYTDNGTSYPSYINAFGARWLRIVRTGNTFQGYYSVNGTTWQYAFAVSVPMNNCIQVGLIASGTNSNSVVTASFDNVVIDPPYGNNQPRGINNANGTSFVPSGIPAYTLWPNPSTGIVAILVEETLNNQVAGSVPVNIEVVNGLGKQVKYLEADIAKENVINLDLSNQSAGIYFVRIRDVNGLSFVQKLVIAK